MRTSEPARNLPDDKRRGLFKQNEAGCSGGSAGKRSNQGKYGRDFPAS